MKAVVYKGPYKIAVEEIEEPEIQTATEAIIRITSTSISDIDLYMYEGKTSVQPGMVFGHEIIGIVDSVGTAVSSIQEDDRVVLPFNIACGYCFNCIRGYTNVCLTMNPQRPGASYGWVNKGSYQGGQAEYIKVPFADFNCLKLPGEPYDQWEDDFILLSDVFSTGYFATASVKVKPGSTVAVFGAGPTGLMAAYSCLIKGASEVYVVDSTKEKLEKVKEIGAIPIDSSQADPAEQIINWRKSNTSILAALLPGEKKMIGVDCAIGTFGYQPSNVKKMKIESKIDFINNLVKIINYAGNIFIDNQYIENNINEIDEKASSKNLKIIWKKLFSKGVSLVTGLAPVKKYAEYLRNLIIGGQAKPSVIITKEHTLDETPLAYENYLKKKSDYIKVVIRTGLAH